MSEDWTAARAFELVDRLGHAHALLQARSEALVTGLDVSVSELVALFVLLSFPDGISQTDWGRLQGVSRQRAHTVTKRLLAAGLVHCEVQGRASTITLTATGDALATGQRERFAAVAFSDIASLSASEALALHRGLGKLITALESPPLARTLR